MVLLLALAVLPLAGPAVPAPSVESKQAEAAQVLAQIQELDANLELKVEAYNAAQIELDKIAAEQRANERRLKIAKSQPRLGAGEPRGAPRRAVQGRQPPTSSRSCSAPRASTRSWTGSRRRTASPTRTRRSWTRCRRFRAEVKQREAELKNARAHQEQVVAERAAQKQAIEGQLAERAAASCPRSRTRSPSCRPRSGPRSSAWRLRRERASPRSPARAAAGAALRRRSTAASSGSPCSTSAPRTCGAAPRRAASTARASSCTCTRRSASRSRATRRCSTASGRPSRAPSWPGRPRLLQRPRPRGHLHRRQPVHPLAAHGRRRQDLVPARAGTPPRTSAPGASSASREQGSGRAREKFPGPGRLF